MVTVSKNKNEHLEDYIVDDESKLDDESFREIFNEILDSTSIIEKIRIIKENINAKKTLSIFLNLNVYLEKSI